MVPQDKPKRKKKTRFIVTTADRQHNIDIVAQGTATNLDANSVLVSILAALLEVPASPPSTSGLNY